MRSKIPPREIVGQRNRPERVKPLTLGALDESGVAHIEAECEWCRHAALVPIAPLMQREGRDTPFREIVRRLTCSVCGWKRVEAWPVRTGRDAVRRDRQPAPLPSLDECRALVAAVSAEAGEPPADHRARLVGALRERWPQLTAPAALFIVQALRP